MLRVIVSQSAKAAKSYYASGLSREDYYTQEQEIVGHWGGLAAERLGLSGQVTQNAFDALCDNRHPTTGERLTPRTRENRRVGYDLNFHCPKSVSVAYALTEDDAILSAFRVAVRETMEELETDMHTRVRKGGKAQSREDRQTGNLVYGEFVHFTARPVNGVPDPHLHAHCFTFNVTHDTAEDRWKAGEFSRIKRDASYYEAAFHARLAGNLAGLGYGIERKAKSWELAGVPQSVVDSFSRRTAEIEAFAKDKGITDAKAKDKLGAKTRAGKRKGQALESLKADWRARLSPEESAAVASAWGQPSAPHISDAQAMDYALEHSFERQSVVSEKELMATALRHGVGSVTVEGVRREAARGEILKQNLDGERSFTTTRAVLAEEKACIDAVKKGRGKCAPLGKTSFQFETDFLNGEQKAAVRHVLTSRDRVMGIRGGAGVGKTTLMKEAVRGIEEGGRKVHAFAPSADASRGTLRAEGFEKAETVAALLSSKEKQAEIKGQVVWIDEAGQLGSRQMAQILKLAEKQNARVVLAGDVRQHNSVDRGDALRLLEDKGGLRTAQVNEIQRQRGSYKEAVAAVSRGDFAGGFERLDALGAIIEREGDGRYKELAQDYVKAQRAGKTVLAVSPTHAEGQKVTDAIRAEMKNAGLLAAKGEHSLVRLEKLQLTEAQKKDARHYEPGQVVQFSTDAPNIKRGEKLRVSKIEGGKVTVTDEYGGKPRHLPLDKAGRFQLYREKRIELASGDRIRITQNGYTARGQSGKEGHRLNNGAMYDVAGFSPTGDIKLTNGWTVSKNFGHINHGYCSTSHASQSKTVDRVLIAQGQASLSASSREQFYVSVSRGRESVKLYTDNKAAVKEAVAASGQRMSATELTERQQKGGRFREAVKAQAERMKRAAQMAKTQTARTVTAVKRVAEAQRERQKQKTAEAARTAQRQPQRGMEYER